MNCYGYQFEPRFGLQPWLFAAGVEGDKAEEASKRIHRDHDLGRDLVFCGRPPHQFQPEPEYIGSWSSPTPGTAYVRRVVDLLVLCPSGDPAEAARFFEVGTHSMMSGPKELNQIYALISAVHADFPVSPIIVNPAAFVAQFRTRIDGAGAGRVLRLLDKYGNHGAEIYCEADWEYRDQGGAAGMLVREQELHLWWD
jgi:hypothetical protein